MENFLKNIGCYLLKIKPVQTFSVYKELIEILNFILIRTE